MVIEKDEDADVGVGAGDEEREDGGADAGDEGGDDGAQDPKDEEAGQDESEQGGDAGDDGEGEGGEDDQDREGDAGKGEKGSLSETEALKELLKQRDEEVVRLRKAAEEKGKPAPGAPEAQKEMTEEEWAAAEERFGGLPRTQLRPLGDFVSRAVESVKQELLGELVSVKKELAISRMAEAEGTRDIRALRPQVEEFLKHFAPRTHADERILGLALAYARGIKSGSGKSGDGKVRDLRVAGAGKPNMTGKSAGGSSGGVRLTPQQREAARLGGMSEKEYAALRSKRNK